MTKEKFSLVYASSAGIHAKISRTNLLVDVKANLEVKIPIGLLRKLETFVGIESVLFYLDFLMKLKKLFSWPLHNVKYITEQLHCNFSTLVILNSLMG